MIKLLKSLRDFPAENSFILTYNLDLPFYEAAVFETLYGYGCRNSVVICDPRQYQIALQDTALLRYAGQRYLLQSGLTSPRGAFHPKLILLTNKTTGRLFLASTNLSRPGYTHNWEVVTDFKFDSRRPDPVAWHIFQWSIDLLEKVAGASDQSGLIKKRTDRLLGTTPWLRKEFELGENRHVWALHNLEESMLDQILARYHRYDGSPVKEAYIVSPFFDKKALAFSALLSHLQPDGVHVFTQDGQGLQKSAIEDIQKKHSTPLVFHSLLELPRRLHAKTILLKTENGVWLATGSANFSAPALLRVAEQGNTELLVLRFEKDASYYDEWMEELTAAAMPMDWGIVPPVEHSTTPSLASSPLSLEAAYLRNKNLEIKLVPEPAPGSLLSVITNGDQLSKREYVRWSKTETDWISLPCSKKFLKKAEFPTLVSIEVVQDNGSVLQTKSVLLHNLVSLEKFSKPLRHSRRPTIPEGLITENAEHYAELLEMVHGLVITNQEQLERHNPRIVAQRKQEKEELEIAEEYDPDAHIVAEPIRRSLGGIEDRGELYVDYEERLTYQEILNAVLSITYQTEKNIELREVPLNNSDTLVTEFAVLEPFDDEEIKARIQNRISSSFKRIIDNFSLGLSDSEYIETVPKPYLLELWVIISSLLRVIWRSELLSEQDFQEYSLTHLYSFWGNWSQQGAWKQIEPFLGEDERQHEFSRLSLSLNLWMHVIALAKSLDTISDRRIFAVAGLIRFLLMQQIFTLDNLLQYSESVYWRSWETSFPQTTERLSLDASLQYLLDLSRKYDTASLKNEISYLAGRLPAFEFGNIANVLNVPKMFVTLPLSDQNLDLCWKIYQKFFFHPSQKTIAWARFINANPCIDDQDIQQVTMFYSVDKQFLLFAITRQKSDASEEIERENFLMEALQKITSIEELKTYKYKEWK